MGKWRAVLGATTALFMTAGLTSAATLTFSPNVGPPGTRVTVDLQLDAPPPEGTRYVMALQASADNPNNFAISDDIPFDADGHAIFTFIVPDVEPGPYTVSFGCWGEPDPDACIGPDAADMTPFEGATFTVSPGALEFGTVIFRLTLSGPVPEDVGFLIYRQTQDDALIEPGGYVCWVPDIDPPPCRSGETYEWVNEFEVGTVLDYHVQRNQDGEIEQMLFGTVTVEPGTRVVNLGYEYPSSLPDTALSAPAGLEN